MEGVVVVIRYDGTYNDNGLYENFKVTGTILAYDSDFNKFCENIKSSLQIENIDNSRMDIKFDLGDGSPLCSIACNSHLSFYKGMKRADLNGNKYPVIVDVKYTNWETINEPNIAAVDDEEMINADNLEIGNIYENDVGNIFSVDDINLSNLTEMTEKTTQIASNIFQHMYSLEGVEESDLESQIDISKVNEVKVGYIFSNKVELKATICHLSLSESFNYKVRRSCDRKYHLVCINDKCTWFLKASRIGKSDEFQFRKYNKDHNCESTERFKANRHATSFFVAKMVKETFKSSVTYYGPKSIQATIKDKYFVEVDYHKAWRAREQVTCEVYGRKSDSYQRIPSYLHMLEESNPGSITKWKTYDDGSFLYAFFALVASIEGSKYCRPQFVVDGTFLSTAYGGTLLTACTYNPGGGILPLAFAIVDSENSESYHWFFQCIREAFGYNDQMCFISDGAPCIANTVKLVYPEAGHYTCIYHLENNIKKYCRKGHQHLHKWFFKAAKAYTQHDFQTAMKELNKINPKIQEHLEDVVTKERWAALYSKHYRRQAMTSNIAESLNSRNRDSRDLPITALLEELRAVVQLWAVKWREQASYTVTKLSKMYDEQIFSRRFEAKFFQYTSSSEHIHKVTENGQCFVVNLLEKTCTCNRFQVDELPCRHAVLIIFDRNLDVSKFCSPFYLNDTLKACYAPVVRPIPTSAEHSIPECVKKTKVNIPARRVQVGRVRKSCYPKYRKKIRVSKCSLCRDPNHNRRTCPNLPTTNV